MRHAGRTPASRPEEVGSVVIAGALDTKGDEAAFLVSIVEAWGLRVLVIDFGVLGEPAFQPTIGRAQVAAAAGHDLANFSSGDHKDVAMEAMGIGLESVVREQHRLGQVGGVIGIGGSGGTSIIARAMRALPIGLPKLIVSTLGGGNVAPYAGTKDIIFAPSVVDLAGLNRVSRAILENAGNAICGMVAGRRPEPAPDRPIVVASMFGNTTPCVERVQRSVASNGFEVLVFHATGIGGRTMESLIAEGLVVGSLDITTTELADEVCGGLFSAGPDRCMAASRAGIPTVLVPGCVDMANFGAEMSMPERFRGRLLYRWNPEVTLLRTNVDENRRIGAMIGNAARVAHGPVTVLLPRGGVSMLDAEGGLFWDPDADEACFAAIKKAAGRSVRVEDLDHNINAPEFADRLASVFLEMERTGART